MSRSAALRLADLRAISALVGECRELGDDPIQWRTHLNAGMARLVGAGLVISTELSRCVHGPRACRGAAIWGWENGFDPTGWARLAAVAKQNPDYNPLMNAYITHLPGENGVCLARTELIEDRDWYRSDYYQDLHSPLGGDATLACFRSIPGAPDDFAELYLIRRPRERDFLAREKSIIREAHALVAPHIGGPLASFYDPSPADLPPLARRVLKCFLEGDSDKQAAARLDLTRHTVNGYAKMIYRHFGVQSRAELLARWIKRGWGSRCEWV